MMAIMGSSRVLFFLLALNYLVLTFSSAQTITNSLVFESCSNDRGNFTANSAYETNLNSLLSSFSSITANDYGFYNLSVGQNSDRVYAIALCRGDVNPDVCLSCINNATPELTNLCPNRMEAAITYDFCKLRYSNRSIFGVMDSTARALSNNINVTDENSFKVALNDLLVGLMNTAASGGSLRKFATGNDIDSAFDSIYALLQCTPDISQGDCTTCLERSFEQIPHGRRGVQVNTPSCNLRFEMERFYNISADAPPPPPPSTGNYRPLSCFKHVESTILYILYAPSAVSPFVFLFNVSKMK